MAGKWKKLDGPMDLLHYESIKTVDLMKQFVVEARNAMMYDDDTSLHFPSVGIKAPGISNGKINIKNPITFTH